MKDNSTDVNLDIYQSGTEVLKKWDIGSKKWGNIFAHYTRDTLSHFILYVRQSGICYLNTCVGENVILYQLYTGCSTFKIAIYTICLSKLFNVKVEC